MTIPGGLISSLLAPSGPPPVSLTISASTQNYNIYTSAGSPSTAKAVTLTINNSVKVYSNSTSQPALDTGSLPSGSTVKIVNNGTIVGKGGNGGYGGSLTSYQSASCSNPAPGVDGGNAISTTAPLIIDNTNGFILGGGGGGGGGRPNMGFGWTAGGGGGGGGAGNTFSNTSGGNGGGADCYPTTCSPGQPGTGGSNTAGAGGAGGAGAGWNPGAGGVGGNGGDYGQPGQTGGEIVGGSCYPTGSYCNCPAAAGGAAGKAINLNGYTATFTGGNNGTQVKGAVS